MSCPSMDASPLEYTLFNVYKGNFTPPPNFTEMTTEECANTIKIMSDIKIKTIGAQINKYKRNYEKSHSDTHSPQLYKLCTRIVIWNFNKYPTRIPRSYIMKPNHPASIKHPHNVINNPEIIDIE